MIAQPTYLFGLGATKAGTTWLHRYLAGHPDCHVRTVKELHWFNSRGDGHARQTAVIRAQLARVEARLAATPARWLERRRRDLADWLSVLMVAPGDDAAYRIYLEQGLRERRLVADITPAYSELGADDLAAMGRVAPDCRFVYLLREPVARVWSHVRMVARRAPGGQQDYAGECARVLDRVLAGQPSEISRRADYRGTLERLTGAIAPERLLVMFQEHLLSVPGLQRLCAFLGIRPHAADTAARVHEGVALAMTAGQAARIRAWLLPQYEFVARAMPDMPQNWRATMDGRIA